MSDDIEKLLLARREALLAEVRKIDTMLRAAGAQVPKISVVEIRQEKHPIFRTRSKPTSLGLTINQMLVGVLSDSPQGLKSTEVAEAIKRKYGREISAKHCRSALSTLKSKKEITLEDGLWRKNGGF